MHVKYANTLAIFFTLYFITAVFTHPPEIHHPKPEDKINPVVNVDEAEVAEVADISQDKAKSSEIFESGMDLDRSKRVPHHHYVHRHYAGRYNEPPRYGYNYNQGGPGFGGYNNIYY